MDGLAFLPIWETLTLGIGGLIIGCLAGLLGIGGGILIVPMMVSLGFPAMQAVATSTVAMLLISISGSLQNWRMGQLNFQKTIALGFPSLLTAQLGVYLLEYIPSYILMSFFVVLVIASIYLIQLRRKLSQQEEQEEVTQFQTPAWISNLGRFLTGSCSGLLAGLFGISGGVIMVPLQIILLGEPMSIAVPTSLAVVVISASSAFVGHAVTGNVLYSVGILLGITGAIGVQIGTRLLPRIPQLIKSFTKVSLTL